MGDETFVIPEAPALLPERLKKQWQETYAKAFKRAQTDFPDDPAAHERTALREANRLLRVDEPKSHAEALALEDWQLMKREERGGKLVIHTIDGKKCEFDIPARAHKPVEPVKEEKGAKK